MGGRGRAGGGGHPRKIKTPMVTLKNLQHCNPRPPHDGAPPPLVRACVRASDVATTNNVVFPVRMPPLA